MNESDPQACGDKFSLELFYKARELALLAISSFQKKMFVGMSESCGVDMIKKSLEELGLQRMWHPIKFRIGSNTKCSFREKSDPAIRLQENDIYFIDIGPVFFEHEADYGETFVFGESELYTKLSLDVKKIFNHLKDKVTQEGLTGRELYQYASGHVEELGYEFNPQMKGHRLSDFPHAIFYKKGLSDFDKCPLEDRWILEVHIRSIKEDIGAFFEDLI